MVYDHLIAKLKEEKDPMNDYFEDLQRKMRLMNQKLLEEAKERKFLKKVKGELKKGLEKLEKDEGSEKDRYMQKHMRIQRILGEIQKIGEPIRPSNKSGQHRVRPGEPDDQITKPPRKGPVSERRRVGTIPRPDHQ